MAAERKRRDVQLIETRAHRGTYVCAGGAQRCQNLLLTVVIYLCRQSAALLPSQEMSGHYYNYLKESPYNVEVNMHPCCSVVDSE
jgi:hypothetical protein